MGRSAILPRGGPAIVLGLTSSITIGAIFYSHYSQVRDKAEMRAGVERDKERMRLRRKMKKEAERQQRAGDAGGQSADQR
mmetsp:Transcript_14062/g.41214  ORF Transcript_14062/g.41214 Transcript_14062/m.41214 type:complete len:80 (+) Transcript_14062:192-431(+)